jgi:hypothetical protein
MHGHCEFVLFFCCCLGVVVNLSELCFLVLQVLEASYSDTYEKIKSRLSIMSRQWAGQNFIDEGSL